MKKIYLSPSNQPANKYITGSNEKTEMEAVANKVKAILDNEFECETVMATLSLGIHADGRPLEAKKNGCDVYLAIHSNAGGGGKATGAIALYHPGNAASISLASNIVKELNKACPIKSNRAQSVINGMKAFSGAGYGEIRTPSSYGLISVLAETDFHDNPTTANWIINNKDAIARAYVNALTLTFNITKKKPASDEPKQLYCVQVGAYTNKENADAMLAKLKAAGFENAFIKTE